MRYFPCHESPFHYVLEECSRGTRRANIDVSSLTEKHRSRNTSNMKNKDVSHWTKKEFHVSSCVATE